MSTPSPIIVRAKLTEEEWSEIRKQAIDQRIAPSELIGRALRASLLQPKEQTQP